MITKLGEGFVALSVIGIAGAFLWWMRFYSDLNYAFTGRAGPLPVECLYERSGPCRIISDVANWLDYPAYDPMLLWLSGAFFVIGIMLVIVGSIARPQEHWLAERREPRL